MSRFKVVNELEPFKMMSDAIDEVMEQQKCILVISGDDAIAAHLRAEMLNAWDAKKAAFQNVDNVKVQPYYIKSCPGVLWVAIHKSGCMYTQNHVILYKPQDFEHFRNEFYCTFPMVMTGGSFTVVTENPEVIDFCKLHGAELVEVAEFESRYEAVDIGKQKMYFVVHEEAEQMLAEAMERTRKEQPLTGETEGGEAK